MRTNFRRGSGRIRPTARVLATLEMLQVHGQMTGAELARRLEVDGRTVRKYVETLRDLGVPIEAVRGRAGMYRLRPGTRLPPLMFSDDEAVALVLGLLIAQRSGLADEVQLPAVLAKIDCVLPETTRQQVDAVAKGIALEPLPGKPAPPLQTVSVLAKAALTGRRVQMDYDPISGGHTVRELTATASLLRRRMASNRLLPPAGSHKRRLGSTGSQRSQTWTPRLYRPHTSLL